MCLTMSGERVHVENSTYLPKERLYSTFSIDSRRVLGSGCLFWSNGCYTYLGNFQCAVERTLFDVLFTGT